jgi:hypothetical protein
MTGPGPGRGTKTERVCGPLDRKPSSVQSCVTARPPNPLWERAAGRQNGSSRPFFQRLFSIVVALSPGWG